MNEEKILERLTTLEKKHERGKQAWRMATDRLDKLEAEEPNEKVESLEKKVKSLEKKVKTLEKKVKTLVISEEDRYMHDDMIDKILVRLETLERDVKYTVLPKREPLEINKIKLQMREPSYCPHCGKKL